MLYLPAAQNEKAPTFLGTQSYLSLGPDLRSANANPASVAWGTINQIVYVPFRLPEGVTVRKLWTYNGATAAGNTEVSIYTRAGAELISSGVVAQSGINTFQEFDTTDTYLQAGQYWFGLTSSSATATFFGYSNLPYAKLWGCQAESGAGGNPATATFAVATAVVPMVGLSLRVTL